MQKIHIKNFGAIKEAEIDIDQVLILIGEQASGKSTIAKLIYFFQGLSKEYSANVISDKLDKGIFEIVEIIKNKFYEAYGNTYSNQLFEITYYSDTKKTEEEKFFRIKNTIKGIIIELDEFSTDFFHLLGAKIKKTALNAKKEIKNNHNNLNPISIDYEEEKILLNFFSKFFNHYHEDFSFTIAGRSATVQYSDLFEKQLYAYLQNKIENNKNLKKIRLREQTLDELLTFAFMEKVETINKRFEDNGGTFKTLLEQYRSEALTKAEEKIYKIIKGEYNISSGREIILINKDADVLLKNASSGQQESIRILQDLFLVILKEEKTLRIIEEPEAHLFPVAQKQLVELLALMVNQNEGNTLIITTHSPYILSAFNNLLFAHRVVEKNPDTEADVEKIVDKDFRLNPARFAAYTLVENKEEGGYVSESIMSERGLISENYLDNVSDMLGAEFNNLVSIYSKKPVLK